MQSVNLMGSAKCKLRKSLGTSPKWNDGGDGRPWGVAAQSWATAPATLTEKRAMKKEEEEINYFRLNHHY